MGLSSSKTTTTSGPSAQALPFLQSASGAVQGTYDANKGNLGQIGSSLFDAYKTYSANQGQDLTGARGYAGDVLGGKYLNGNPALQGMIDQTDQSVTDRVNALFSQAGQTGSSRQVGELGKQLSNSENALRYQNYGDEMNRMGQAAQLGLGLNSAVNSNAATQGALGEVAAETPYIGVDKLAAALGSLWGNSQTTTQKQSGNIGQALIGAAGQAAGAFAAKSDRRLKKDIVKLGEMEDGLGVYSYRYITQGGGDPIVGVMADEIEKLRPWALGPKYLGEYSTVYYDKLGSLEMA